MGKLKRALAVLMVLAMLAPMVVAEEEAIEPAAPVEEIVAEPEAPAAEPEAPEAEPEAPAEEEPAEEPAETPVEEAEAEESYEAEQLNVDPCPEDEHVWGENPEWQDNTFHIVTCTVCGAQQSTDHSAWCTSPNLCYECNGVRDNEHDDQIHHDAGQKYETLDASQHQVICDACDAVLHSEDHVLADGVCSLCGYDSNASVQPCPEDQHDFVIEWVDKERHQSTCTVCGETDWDYHFAYCDQPFKCIDCGGACDYSDWENMDPDIIAEHFYHRMQATPVDSQYHAYICKVDGTVGNQFEHWYEDGSDICAECGYVQGTEVRESCADGEHDPDYDNPVYLDEEKHGYRCTICGNICLQYTHTVACNDPTKTCEDCGAQVGEGFDDFEHAEPDEEDMTFEYKNNKSHVWTCSRCGEEVEEAHEVHCSQAKPYTCEICGYEVNLEAPELLHDPDYDHYTSINALVHGNKCKLCDYVEPGDSIEGFKHWAWCNEPGVCVDCGAEYLDMETRHDMESGVCTRCGYKEGESVPPCPDDEHEWGEKPEWKDNKHHLATCTICGAQELQEHLAYCNTPTLCMDCGGERENDTDETIIHDENAERKYEMINAFQHRVLCTSCNAETNVEDHEFVDGVCKCGYESSTPVEPCPDGEHEWDMSEMVRIDAWHHGYRCTRCGEFDPDSTEEHEGYCDDPTWCYVCDGEDCSIVEWRISHIVDASEVDWQSTGPDMHARYCTGCNEVLESGLHWGSCTTGTCDECGADIRGTTHVSHNTASSTFGHDDKECWLICDDCKEIVGRGPHQLDCGDDTQTCKRCGTAGVTGMIEHEPDYENWQADDTHHWHACARCGMVLDKKRSHRAECGDGPYVCTVCGHAAVDPIQEHDIDYSTYVGDETGHWHACTRCGAKEDMDRHSVRCDDTEGKCQYCGEPAGPHAYVTHEESDDINGHDEHYHWYACTICDRVLYRSRHVADCDNPGVCTECGAEATNPVIEHDYDDYTYLYDETHHWNVCTRCEAVINKVPHYAECDRPNYCIDCGHEFEHVLTYEHAWTDEYQSDGTYHWKICPGCGEVCEKALHSVTCDSDTPNICEDCGMPAEHAYVEHDPDYEVYEHDDFYHWNLCTLCGAKTEIYSHSASCTDPGYCIECLSEVKCARIVHDDTFFDVTAPVGWDENFHWTECQDCGERFSEAHYAFEDDPSGACYACGMPAKRVKHEWDMSLNFGHNDKYHWRGCLYCDAKIEVEEHHFSCADGKCEECGAEMPKGAKVEHGFGYDAVPVYKDGKTHVYTCIFCGEEVAEPHTAACDSKNPNLCELCGHEATELVKTHGGDFFGNSHYGETDFATYYQVSEDGCSLNCSLCKETLSTRKHEVYCYSDGACVFCGYKPKNPTVLHEYAEGKCIFCGEADPSATPTPDVYIVCTPATGSLIPKESVTIQVKTVGLAKKESYTYENSDETVVSVSKKGKVTAKQLGTAKITVTGATSKQSAVCEFTVRPAPEDLTLTAPGVTSYTTDDGPLTLTASILPADADQSVTWTTSAATVATVENGVVTLVGEGTAKITATAVKKTAKGKKKSKSFTLSVTDNHKPAAISVDGDATQYVNLGETLQLGYVLTPVEEGKTPQSTVTWSIPKKQQKLATVDPKTGLLQAFDKEGSVTVTVKTDKKGGTGKKLKQLTAKVKVVVADPKKPREVKIDQGSAIAMYAGTSTLQLNATVVPASAQTGLEWSIPAKQQKIAKIDSNGLITAVAQSGTVTVTVKTTEKKVNKKVASATIKVTVGADPTVPFSVAIDQVGPLELKKGQELPLTATIEPAGATAKKGLTWSSSNKKVATVDKQSGVVKGIKKGSVTITVKTENGKKATIKIKVVP